MPHLISQDREIFYREACLSIAEQTRQPDQIIIEWDPDRTGIAPTLNRGLARVECEWIARLDDDDFLLQNHIEQLLANSGDADVVYPDCLQLGAAHDIGGDFDADRLMAANYIPGGGSLIRTAAARAVGGWCRPEDPDWHPQYDDWVMWKRLHTAGYRFVHVPQATWVYRFHALQTVG